MLTPGGIDRNSLPFGVLIYKRFVLKLALQHQAISLWFSILYGLLYFTIYITYESGISPLPEVLALGDTRVHVGSIDYSDMTPNIEASID